MATHLERQRAWLETHRGALEGVVESIFNGNEPAELQIRVASLDNGIFSWFWADAARLVSRFAKHDVKLKPLTNRKQLVRVYENVHIPPPFYEVILSKWKMLEDEAAASAPPEGRGEGGRCAPEAVPPLAAGSIWEEKKVQEDLFRMKEAEATLLEELAGIDCMRANKAIEIASLTKQMMHAQARFNWLIAKRFGRLCVAE